MYIYDTITGRSRRFSSWGDAYQHWYHEPRNVHYTYFLHDLNAQTVIPFQTAEELLAWWHTNAHDFQLNMTCQDTYATIMFHCSADRIYKDVACHLRPYLITDEYGRTIDIRLWTDITPAKPKPYRYNWHTSGARPHSHRKNGPSMYRRTLRNEAETDEWIQDDETYARLLRCRRHSQNIDAWEYYDRAHTADWTSSKCWKDQSKAPRQYWKHKKGVKLPPEKTAPNETDETYDEYIFGSYDQEDEIA